MRNSEEDNVKPIDAFDKFMDDILIKESHSKTIDAEEDTPARKLMKRRAEHYLTKTRVVR